MCTWSANNSYSKIALLREELGARKPISVYGRVAQQRGVQMATPDLYSFREYEDSPAFQHGSCHHVLLRFSWSGDTTSTFFRLTESSDTVVYAAKADFRDAVVGAKTF